MNPQPKPARGTHVLDREAQRYQLEQAELRAKAAAKRRDSWGCRWPESGCRGNTEVAHVRDKSLGGSSETSNLMCLCEFHHRRGPVSIHGKQIKVECETPLGADGPCSFWRRDAHDVWVCVGVELAIGVLRKD